MRGFSSIAARPSMKISAPRGPRVPLSLLTAIDLIGLEIASGGGQKRRVDARACRTIGKIADGVLTFGGAPIFHVDQHRWSVGRVRLGEHSRYLGGGIEGRQWRMSQRGH